VRHQFAGDRNASGVLESPTACVTRGDALIENIKLQNSVRIAIIGVNIY